MPENSNRLLVLDDEPDIVKFIAEVAANMGFDVAGAGTAHEFLGLLDDFRPSVIVLDLQIPQTDGIELLRQLVERDCKAHVLLVSGIDKRVIVTTYELGLSRGLSMIGTLEKPVFVEDLESKLSQVYEHARTIEAADLGRALDEQSLIPYYQPKAELVSGGRWVVNAVEALVRWQHPEYGLVMPDEFIPLAERAGLIGGLTEQVLDMSLSQVRRWREGGLELKCAVNLPPSLITDLNFPDRVAALLAQYGLDGSHLALEVTETATMQDPTRAMDILTRLRVKRIGLSLDDFGTGFSSLTRLYQMPFDEVKIDKSLILNVPHSREANTMVSSLIELGHNLGLKVCAEGVESRAALELLATLGCDTCQGYFLSRAVPAGEIPSFVSRWNAENSASVQTIDGAVSA